MHLGKKHLVIVALVGILVVTNIAFAVLYMTKSVNISGGVSVVGAIEVYDGDGVTPLTSITFENFTGGTLGVKSHTFFVNNTGTVPVYVYWNISASSIIWTAAPGGALYVHYVDDPVPDTTKYNFQIQTGSGFGDNWHPNDGASPEAVYLDVDGGQYARFYLMYYGEPVTAETFTLTVSFYAQDA